MKNSSLPLYKQIANKLKEDIEREKLVHGDAIPSEAKLSQTYNASRVTIREAIKLLVDEGILYRVQGSGTYISLEKIEHNILKLQGFTEEMSNLNTNVTNKVLEFQLTFPSKKMQQLFKIDAADKVYYIKRLRFADKEPLILEHSYLPVSLFSDLSIDSMTHSKYQYISSKGHKIDKRYGEITPLIPNEELMEHFNIKKEDPLLYLEAYSAFENGIVFEYSNIYFHPYKYNFNIVSTRADDSLRL
ncbi:GntR family transcriptional regulator [Paraliobacillus sp. JSM ZJ581]|uniref:GntR family transcriptional regulator n=1 Tax=Paraliobacillus sp. JSM ZJ581 TaxID=3342118 RepID=UPI0035A81C45